MMVGRGPRNVSKMGLGTNKKKLGFTAACPFSPFCGAFSRDLFCETTQKDYKKVGTLILTSVLEDLENMRVPLVGWF